MGLIVRNINFTGNFRGTFPQVPPPPPSPPPANIGTWYPFFLGDSFGDSITIETSYFYSTPSGATTVLSQPNGGVWSPSRTAAAGKSLATLSNSNRTASGKDVWALVDVPMNSGKWYWEFYVSGATYAFGFFIGAFNYVDNILISTRANVTQNWGIIPTNKGTSTRVSNTFLSSGDRVGFLFDFTASSMTIYRNNTLQGTVTNITI